MNAPDSRRRLARRKSRDGANAAWRTTPIGATIGDSISICPHDV